MLQGVRSSRDVRAGEGAEVLIWIRPLSKGWGRSPGPIPNRWVGETYFFCAVFVIAAAAFSAEVLFANSNAVWSPTCPAISDVRSWSR